MTAAIKTTIVMVTEPPTAMAMIAHMGNPTAAAGWRKRKEGDSFKTTEMGSEG